MRLQISARSFFWLAGGMCLAAAGGLWQNKDNETLAKTRFESLSRRAVEQVASRMHAYEYGLRATRGAVLAAGGESGITRLRFAQFSASRDMEREFPGARGFGFMRRVPPAQEAAFEAAARQDGVPDFKVHQFAPHDGERYVIQYFEPATERDAAIGLDVASETNRRTAAERAMLTGEATLTAPITLMQAGHPLRSFLLLLPVYRLDAPLGRAQRSPRQPVPARVVREETAGWTYAPLVIDEVLKGFDFLDGEFSMTLTDASPGTAPLRFFTSPGAGPAAPELVPVTLPLPLFGREWQVEVTARPAFIQQLNLRSAWAVFLRGTLVAAVLALLASIREVTQRRKDQAGEHRSRLAAIVTNSNDAIIGHGLDGTITDWNDAAATIFGYDAAEAVGQPLQKLLVPVDHVAEEEEVLRHIARGSSVGAFETFRRHRDGHPVAVSVAAAPIRSANGQVIGGAQTVRDITHELATKARILELNMTLEQQVSERTAQMMALSRRERAILAAAGSAIIATDVQGVVTLFNPAAEAMLGYTAAEVVDQMQMNRFHDAFEVHARAKALTAELGRPLEVCEVFARAPGAGAVSAREWTYVRKDGTRIPVHLNVSALRDMDGEVIGFIAIAVDLAERKMAEARLRNSERFMHIVTDKIPGIVAYWTPDLRCTFANSAFERWFGRTPEQMVGTPLVQLLGAEPFARNESYVRAVLAGQEQRMAGSRLLADGSTAHFQLYYVPDRDENGVVKGFISVAMDVTEMRQAQTQLEALNLALNERSAQAESASKAKSEFLANMSHEIRSPLNAVIGLAYLLRQTPLDAAQQSFLQKIDAASGALLSVINDILDISKIEAGGMVLDETEFELGELLNSIVGMMAVNAHDKNIELLLEAEEGLPEWLVGDVTRIRQIVLNLLSNAIKFTAEGSVRLAVRMQPPADGAGDTGDRLRLRFAVLDTGIGIAPEVLARLFTPFMQADNSTTRRFGGTGLGLSIIKQLTELMGGEFGVESRPGSGSEFWVVLPFDVARGATTQPLGADSSFGVLGELGRRLSGIRVLVVDDSPVNLEVSQHILEREGAQVGLAANGREAVERLRATPKGFDIVLMDVHMPVLDGNAAAREIRRELGLVSLPVLALTASALVAERERALESGMNDFITKPFDAEALVRSVRRWVERAQGKRPSLSPLPTHEAVRSAARFPSGWPVIEGIDADDAFKRLGGDAELLRSVLRRLFAEYADLAREGTPTPLRSEVAMLAARLHKLQGSAGMIGMQAVRHLAGDAETLLKDGELERAGQGMRTLGVALRAVRIAARPFLEGAAEDAGEAVAAAPIDPLDLEELVEALRTQSLAAMALFDDLKPSLRTSLGTGRFAALERAMLDLKFKSAIEILQQDAVDSGL